MVYVMHDEQAVMIGKVLHTEFVAAPLQVDILFPSTCDVSTATRCCVLAMG
jgi:hypothetical protein